MPPKKRTRASRASTDSDSDRAAAGGDPTTRQAAQSVGFFDAGIPARLYTLWRKQVHRAIENFRCFGPKETGAGD